MQIAGVKQCVVGYTGGKADNPTYRNIQDYTEALWIEFDPKEISLEELLQRWIRMHSPTNTKAKCQYRAAVWYLNEKQKEIAVEFLENLSERLGKKVTSAVEPATRFYRAEEYHQNFISNQRW